MKNNTVVIDSQSRIRAVDIKELFQFRDLFFFKVLSGYKARFRQSVLSYLWIIITPAVNVLFFNIVFGQLLNVKTGDSSFFLFNASGMLGWLFVSSTLGGSVNGVLIEAPIIQKVYYPRLYLPLIPIVIELPRFFIQFVFTIIILLISGVSVKLGWLLLPVVMLSIVTFSLAIGFFLSSFVVQFRDIPSMLGYFMQFALYSTPLVYSIESVPEAYQGLYLLNPFAIFVESFRSVILHGELSYPYYFLGASLFSGIILWIGIHVFRMREPNIVDAI